MLNGSPVDQWNSPVTLQPPTRALPSLPIPLPKALPRPIGRSITQFELIWCFRSKSETARNWSGCQELMTWLEKPPTLPPLVSNTLIRSALEPTSIDLENV